MPPLAMLPVASRSYPCTIPSPTRATSSLPAADTWRLPVCRLAVRVRIRTAARLASTPRRPGPPRRHRRHHQPGPRAGLVDPPPQANIGLATRHRFDVLDVDGPTGAQALRELTAAHGLHSSGPLVRTGGGGWHFYLAPTDLGNVQPQGLEHVDWRGRGGYVVAPPSRHATGHPYQWAAGRDLDTPPGPVPAVLWERLQPRQRQRPTGPVQPPAAADRAGGRYAQAALAEELARVAAAPVGRRNRQLWESTRNLYNLVATGALDHRQVDQALLVAAERCGLLAEEPRQTRRTLASGRQIGLAHPGRPRQPTSPERTHASPIPPARAAGERTQEGR